MGAKLFGTKKLKKGKEKNASHRRRKTKTETVGMANKMFEQAETDRSLL